MKESIATLIILAGIIVTGFLVDNHIRTEENTRNYCMQITKSETVVAEFQNGESFKVISVQKIKGLEFQRVIVENVSDRRYIFGAIASEGIPEGAIVKLLILQHERIPGDYNTIYIAKLVE